MGAPLLALVLAGCGQPDVNACEQFVRENLRSPASYRRVSVEVQDQNLTASEYHTIAGDDPRDALMQMGDAYHKLGIRSVKLQYDAENGFGASIRETRQCLFRLENGKLAGDAKSFADRAKRNADQLEFRQLLRSGAVPNVSPG